MYSRFHYILILLVIISIYLFYLIGFYTLQQSQTSSFMEGIQEANIHITVSNIEKEFLAKYIRTPAYQTQVAKATHNKKLPWEEAINIIQPDEVDNNKDIDSRVIIALARKTENDPMKNMSNPEKWWYLIRKWL